MQKGEGAIEIYVLSARVDRRSYLSSFRILEDRTETRSRRIPHPVPQCARSDVGRNTTSSRLGKACNT